ncbi:uncharacterized protein LOC107037564 [Diachasma alloeum]|uniref:uncharacterized protein LOC107037564 n=1 Tax=Diachasma alloeum TaxID=454923 RepID=UPI0007383407|nr:uncharacterized protein LOC107037564 [Diachasma alloeum]
MRSWRRTCVYKCELKVRAVIICKGSIMDKKKAKLVESKTPAQLLHEKLAKCGSTAQYELVYDWTKGTTNVPKFTWKVTVGDQEAFGTDNSKKKAKQDAARNLLMQISDDIELLKALPQNTGENMQNHIGNLSMFCARNELPQPQYHEDIEDGPAHKRRFYWNCIVGQHREVGVAHATKSAKQLAAQAMYLKLVGLISNPNDADLPDYRLNTETMPLCKIEKSEKLEPQDKDEMDVPEADHHEPISPEPLDFDERYDDEDRRQSVRYSPRRRENEHRMDRRYENEDYNRIDYPSTSRFPRSERPHTPERSRNITIASEECLERKYKLQLSSFTEWDIPVASEMPRHDEAPGENDPATAEPHLLHDSSNVKREMKYSHSIDAAGINEDENNHSLSHATSDDPRDPEVTQDINDLMNTESQEHEEEPGVDVTEHKIQPEVKFKIKLGGFATPSIPAPDASGSAIEPQITASGGRGDIPKSPESQVSQVNVSPDERVDGSDSIGLQTGRESKLKTEDDDKSNKHGIEGRGTDSRYSATISSAREATEASREPGDSSDVTARAAAPPEDRDLFPEYSMKLEMADLSFKTGTMDVRDSRERLDNTDNCTGVHDDNNESRGNSLEEVMRELKPEPLMDISSEGEHTSNDSWAGLRRMASARGASSAAAETLSDCKVQEEGPENGDQKQLSERSTREVHSNALKREDFGRGIDERSSSLQSERVRTVDNAERLNGSAERSNGNVCLTASASTAGGKEDKMNGNYLDQKESAITGNGEPIVEVKKPLDMTISHYYYMMLTEHGIDLKPKVCNRICDLIDALAKWDVVKNPHIVEEGIAILKDIIVLIDLHLDRVVYQAYDGEYIVVIYINSISEIVEMAKKCDLNEANRAVFFKVISRLDKMLL